MYFYIQYNSIYILSCLYIFGIYIIIKLFEILFYSILLPLTLRPNIYSNFSHNEISFSQKNILNFLSGDNINFLITRCGYLDYKDFKSKNKKELKKSINKAKEKFYEFSFLYSYYNLMIDINNKPKKFYGYFIFSGLFFIFYFFIILAYELYMSEIFDKFTLNNEFLFLWINLPIIAYSFITIKIITRKKDFYKDKIVKLYPNNPIFREITKNVLLDYNLYVTSHEVEQGEDNNKNMLYIVINIIIAIYLTVSIPLVYNKIYTSSVKIDIKKSLETCNK